MPEEDLQVYLWK